MKFSAFFSMFSPVPCTHSFTVSIEFISIRYPSNGWIKNEVQVRGCEIAIRKSHSNSWSGNSLFIQWIFFFGSGAFFLYPVNRNENCWSVWCWMLWVYALRRWLISPLYTHFLHRSSVITSNTLNSFQIGTIFCFHRENCCRCQ